MLSEGQCRYTARGARRAPLNYTVVHSRAQPHTPVISCKLPQECLPQRHLRFTLSHVTAVVSPAQKKQYQPLSPRACCGSKILAGSPSSSMSLFCDCRRHPPRRALNEHRRRPSRCRKVAAIQPTPHLRKAVFAQGLRNSVPFENRARHLCCLKMSKLVDYALII